MTEKGNIRIGTLVNRRQKIKVLSVAHDGTLTWNQITNWYKNPRNNRPFLAAHLKHSRAGKKAVVTDDHPFLSQRGWVVARDLQYDDQVATGTLAPNTKMLELLYGTLLGDATIDRRYPRLGFQHANIQYSQIKEQALSSLVPTSKLLPRLTHSQDWNAKPNWQVYFRKGPWSCRERVRWYDKKGKKHIPQNLELTDLMLAVWFMDDGSLVARNKAQHRPSVRFSVQCFSLKEQTFLCAQLKRLDIEASVSNHCGGELYITADGTEQLMARIGKFVPPSMRYKTNKAPPFDASAWNLGSALVDWDFVEVTPIVKGQLGRKGFPSHNNFYEDQTVYCLDVEDTHNFVTPGGVVHNCPFAERCNKLYGYGTGLEWER